MQSTNDRKIVKTSFGGGKEPFELISIAKHQLEIILWPADMEKIYFKCSWKYGNKINSQIFQY